MKKSLLFLSLFAFIFFLGCSSLLNQDNTECNNPDYSNCDTQEPSVGLLEIKFSDNTDVDSVLIEVFVGNFENDDVLFSNYEKGGYVEVSAPLNKEYSATALYYKNGQKITAVDGDYFKKTGTILCDSTCWSISGGRFDLKLK